MDSSTSIAIAGLVATAVAGIGSGFVATWVGHVLQNRREVRQHQQTLEDEQRRRRWDLLNERLAVIDEAVSLMGQHISTAEGIALGMPLLADRAASEERIKRFETIHNKAWNLVGITGSDELRNKYSRLVTIYWRTRQSDLGNDYHEANETQKTIYKLLDDMRSRA